MLIKGQLSKMKASVWYALFCMSPLFLLAPLGMDLFLPVLPEVERYFDMDQSTAQLSVTIYLIFMSFGQLFWGPVADKKGRKLVAILGISVFIIGSGVAAMSSTTAIFLLGRVIQAIGGSACFVTAYGIVRDIFDGHNLVRAVSYIGAVISIIPVMAPSIGAILTSNRSWTFLFLCMMYFGAVCFVFITLMIPKTRAAEAVEELGESMWETYKRILSDATFWKYASRALVGGAMFIMFLSFSPIFLMGVLHQDKSEFAILFSLSATILFFGSIYNPRLVKKWGVSALTKAAMYLIFVGCVLMAVLSYELAVWRVMLPIVIILVGAVVLQGVTMGPVLERFPLMSGTASSLFNTIGWTGGSFIAITISHTMSAETVFPFILVGAVSLSFAVVVGWVCDRAINKAKS